MREKRVGTRRERSWEKKERVLEVAEQLVARKGIEGVSVRAVTKEAGLSTAMVNYYFGTANGLLETLLGRHAAVLERARMRALAQCRTQYPHECTVAQLVRAFVGETIAYRWLGGTIRELLRALGGGPADGLERVRQELLGVSGRAATQMLRDLGQLLPGVAEEKLWLRWRIAMGGVAATLELSRDRSECLDAVVDELTNVLVSVLTAGTSSALNARCRWQSVCQMTLPHHSGETGKERFLFTA